MASVNYELLRSDLKKFYANTAFPACVGNLSSLDEASEDQMVDLALFAKFDLMKYVVVTM